MERKSFLANRNAARTCPVQVLSFYPACAGRLFNTFLPFSPSLGPQWYRGTTSPYGVTQELAHERPQNDTCVTQFPVSTVVTDRKTTRRPSLPLVSIYVDSILAIT